MPPKPPYDPLDDSLKDHPLIDARERIAESGAEAIEIAGHSMPKADLFKLAGLLVFIAILVVITVALWPLFGDIFTEGGVDRLVGQIRDAGPLGMLMLLGLQILQVVVAFIPGEATQMAAGLLYGPWLGTLIIVIGCVLSSWLIYQVVHRLGQPFVEAMVPMKFLERFRAFERSGKLTGVVFVLFLIPGMPKDTFTYLVPLTQMPLRTYLLITTIARIPGILLSAYAASGLLDGNITQSVIIFALLAIVAVLAIVFNEKIVALFNRR